MSLVNNSQLLDYQFDRDGRQAAWFSNKPELYKTVTSKSDVEIMANTLIPIEETHRRAVEYQGLLTMMTISSIFHFKTLACLLIHVQTNASLLKYSSKRFH